MFTKFLHNADVVISAHINKVLLHSVSECQGNEQIS